MKELTQEEKKESNERLSLFMKEYQALTEKHQADFVNYPQYIPSANGVFQTQIITTLIDKKHLPVPSPIQKETLIKEG